MPTTYNVKDLLLKKKDISSGYYIDETGALIAGDTGFSAYVPGCFCNLCQEHQDIYNRLWSR